MSTKLKINLVLLLLMALSTCYFLYQIDQYEKVMAIYTAQEQNLSNIVDVDKLMNSFGISAPSKFSLSEFMIHPYKLSYDDILMVRQSITSMYRYLFACNAFLVLAIIVVSKTLNKQQADG